MPKWWNLVDALRSGRSGQQPVWVQIPPSAPSMPRPLAGGAALVYMGTSSGHGWQGKIGTTDYTDWEGRLGGLREAPDEVLGGGEVRDGRQGRLRH